jgi:aerobic-type carbon monoxide dehydrogenase small subunit (CoxS/CutS family)
LISLEVNGTAIEVDDDGASLLEVLRDRLGLRAAKDGCSPQGQCGCCTVLVDGEPRVACVTATRRVAGRSITTLEGLDDAVATEWATAFCQTGGSQCGFCTPGIVVRLEALRRRGTLADAGNVERALAAHLCRCTGWQSVEQAAAVVVAGAVDPAAAAGSRLAAATRRASLEGGVHQDVSLDVPLGRGGFADDLAPPDALVAQMAATGEWVVAETLTQARLAAGKVQGRRTTLDPTPPLAVPKGDWDLTLQTSWVDPAYVEVDVSWCEPGREAAAALANGGAFGGKVDSPLPDIARRLADEHRRPVVARWTREDVVRHAPKRPPMALGMSRDGKGVIRVARTPGVADAILAVAPGVTVVEADVSGPPTSLRPRAAGWAEPAVLTATMRGGTEIAAPGGGVAVSRVVPGGLDIEVSCGDPLDEIVVRSYCIGAAAMAIGWVTSEGLAVDEEGQVLDLTVRSLGVVRAADMCQVDVRIVEPSGPPVAVGDAVFASVAAAVWQHQGTPPRWPTGIGFAP